VDFLHRGESHSQNLGIFESNQIWKFSLFEIWFFRWFQFDSTAKVIKISISLETLQSNTENLQFHRSYKTGGLYIIQIGENFCRLYYK